MSSSLAVMSYNAADVREAPREPREPEAPGGD